MRFSFAQSTLASLVLASAVTAMPGHGDVSSEAASCPFLKRQIQNQQQIISEEYMAAVEQQRIQYAHNSRYLAQGDYGVPEAGFSAVMDDLEALLTDSQEFWPGDFDGTDFGPHYGGLFIRLAWHCSGSYRESDGRGGCDGGRIRFPPELTWMDNGNLDKALQLLEPIKEKYGSSLSWGDLIVLAGTAAIKGMGGPFFGFCGGRVDDLDGSASLILGPSDIQEELSPCVSIGQQGRCLSPLGPTTVGLIYVNPEGPLGAEADPVASGEDIRAAFARMGFDDRESVALIGGGHAFGKSHGACPEAPCGEGPLAGKGPNTLTAGFEGAWTSTPTVWSNEYFSNLFNLDWVEARSPAGNIQFNPADNITREIPIMMLTSDLALRDDPAYRVISEEYRDDIASLEDDFGQAWYRLTTADMGPVERCLGDLVPPAQPFQYPLPAASDAEVDYPVMYSDIAEMIETDKAAHIAAFTNLAYQCASTFRKTDYQGGCNGARIRFEPQLSWAGNDNVPATLALLEPIQALHPDSSMADIIVLAGLVAVEMAGGEKMPFCGGRVDAMDGDGAAAFLAPRIYNPTLLTVRDWMQVSGLTPEEGVALMARPTGETFSNQYFMDLQAGTGDFTDMELALLEPEFLDIVTDYASDDAKFKSMFAQAWTKMMVADRFDGPVNNPCDLAGAEIVPETRAPTQAPADDDDDDDEEEETSSASKISFAVTALAAASAYFLM